MLPIAPPRNRSPEIIKESPRAAPFLNLTVSAISRWLFSPRISHLAHNVRDWYSAPDFMTRSLCGWRRWAIPGLFLSVVLFPAKLRAQDVSRAQSQSTAPASTTADLFASSHNLFLPPPAFSLRSYGEPSPRPFEGSTNFHLDAPLLQARTLPPSAT